MAEQDITSEWLLKRRTGGDPELRARVLESLRPIRDRVIDGAKIQPGDTVLDVGCGDGMIAFGVLERYPEATVVFVDVSEALLERCRSLAQEKGVAERCRFEHCGAEDLSQVAAASVDAVTLRSVLIYVADRERAHREFYRVLRPGGRLSYFEPTTAYGPNSRPEPSFWGYPSGPVTELAERVTSVFARLHGPDDPMVTFAERDMVDFAERAGFDSIHLTIEVRADRTIPDEYRHTWPQWLGQAGNPKLPSVGEAIQQALTPEEQTSFERHFRPLVESGAGVFRNAALCLTALKPDGPGHT